MRDVRKTQKRPISYRSFLCLANTPQNFGFLCYIQLVFAFARLFKLSVLVQEVLDELRRICDKLGARALFIVRGISVLGIRAGLSFHSREQLAADY